MITWIKTWVSCKKCKRLKAENERLKDMNDSQAETIHKYETECYECLAFEEAEYGKLDYQFDLLEETCTVLRAENTRLHGLLEKETGEL